MSDTDGPFGGFHSRLTDPDTSYMPIPEKLTEQALKVLRSYQGGVALLDIEAYARARMVGHQRCSDLRRAKFIERCGRRLMPSRKAAYTCRITQAGVAFLKLH